MKTRNGYSVRLALILLISLIVVMIGGMYTALLFEKPEPDELEELTSSVDTGVVHETTEKKAISTGKLEIRSEESSSDYIWIPVEEGIGTEQIHLENHYMEQLLHIRIDGGSSSYYQKNAISGNCRGVKAGVIEDQGDGVHLILSLDGVYEFNTVFEDQVLYVGLVEPRQVYKKIVVIDAADYPADGKTVEGLSRSEIALLIGEELKEKLDNSDWHAYYTRLGSEAVDDEARLYLCNSIKPDLYIRIEVGDNEDSGYYGTEAIYNGTYFIPGFGSVELADSLERSVVTQISGKAGGLIEAGEGDRVIGNATVPAAAIRVGYLSNAQEKILLNRADYRARIVNGIEQAITNCFEQIGE